MNDRKATTITIVGIMFAIILFVFGMTFDALPNRPLLLLVIAFAMLGAGLAAATKGGK